MHFRLWKVLLDLLYTCKRVLLLALISKGTSRLGCNMVQNRDGADTVRLITISEIGEMHLPHLRRWSGRVQYSSGSFHDEEAGSLEELLRRLPAFASSQRSGDIRVKASERIDFAHEDDLLTLLELNKGAKGLDLSKCSFGSMDLGREHIEKSRREFLGRYSFDPSWHARASTRGLDLKGLSAKDCDFDHINLEGADLSSADLDDSRWSRPNLSSTLFHGAKLNRCWFEGADLRGASLNRAELKGANFNGFAPAKLDGATIHRADLTGASFDWVDFRGVVGLGDKTNLQNVRFWGSNLSGVSFEGLDAGSLEGAIFYLATLDRTPMRRDLIGSPIGEELIANRLLANAKSVQGLPEAEVPPAEWLLRASDTYRSLKTNFATLGRSEDTSWAHFQQRRALGRHHWLKWSRDKDRSALLQVGKDGLYWLTAGYGERPLRPLATAAGVILAFAMIYFGTGSWTGDSFSFLDSIIYSGGPFLP